MCVPSPVSVSILTRAWKFALLWQPHNTRWLTPAERHLAQVRLAEDAGEADKDSETDSYVATYLPEVKMLTVCSIFEGLKLALKDRKVLIFMVMAASQLLGLSFINFFPT